MMQSHEEQIIVALRQINQAIDTYSRYLLQEFGLTSPQIATLRLLSKDPDATPGSLADDLHLSPQTMAGILNRLEQRGFVVRCKDERDRRSTRVRITEEGRSAVLKAPALLRDYFRTQLARLQGWEQTQILATLQRVATMMNADEIAVELFLNTVPVPTGSPPAGVGSEPNFL